MSEQPYDFTSVQQQIQELRKIVADAPATTRAELEMERRWTAALHESAHLVAARRLLGIDGIAVLWSDGGGLTIWRQSSDIPMNLPRAVVAAAGQQAEYLARSNRPPSSAPAVEAAIEHQISAVAVELHVDAAQVSKAASGTPDDAAQIARWAITGREHQPDKWARLVSVAHRQARKFCGHHRDEILNAARELFATGIISLTPTPASPAESSVSDEPSRKALGSLKGEKSHR